jgi:hypothetical protein
MFCPHIVFMRLKGSRNKQRIFTYTALTDWFINDKGCVYCAVRTGLWRQDNVNIKKAVPWLRRLVADFWQQRLRLDSNSKHVGFVVHKDEFLGFLSEYFCFSLSVLFHQCSIIIIKVARTRGRHKGSLETFKKSVIFRKSGDGIIHTIILI